MKLSKKKRLNGWKKQREVLEESNNGVIYLDNFLMPKEKPSFWDTEAGYFVQSVVIGVPIHIAGFTLAIVAFASPAIAFGVVQSLVTGDWMNAYYCTAIGLMSSTLANICLAPITNDVLEEFEDSLWR